MKKCVLFLALFALFITGCTLPNQTPNSHIHEYVWVVDVNPTVDEVGYKHKECTICNKEIEKLTEIPKLENNEYSHDLVFVDEVHATCLNEGVKSHYKCTKCEKTFEDDKAEKEIVDLTISKSSHNYSEPSYTWSSDNSCCTAIVTCIYDATHLVKEENIPVETIKSKATCENDGIKVLSVTFKNEIFKQQTKEVTYKEPHTFDENGNCIKCDNLSNKEYLTFSYNSYFNGYEVSAKNQNVTNVEIPSTYNGKLVIGISDSAFSYCNNLESITIPNSVTNIGDFAFKDCYSLKNVYYEGSIEDWCNISFNHSVSNPMYYASHFYLKNEQEKYTELTNLELPNTVTSIGNYQFYGFNNVTSITIPSSVTYISWFAFPGCYKLVEVYNLSSLDIQIGWYYDHGEIGRYAKVIHKDANEPSRIIRTPEGFEFIKDDNDKYYLFNYTGKETSLTLPSDINGSTYEINTGAFYNYIGLTSVTIPSSVTSIGDSAFYNCRGLTSITIPNSVTDVEEEAFYGCYKLVEIYDLSSLDIQIVSDYYSYTYGHLGYYAKVIHKNTNESSRIIRTPEGFEFIKDDNNKYYLFNYTGKETSLTLPNDINGSTYEINIGAFYNNSKITSITIPSGVTGIGDASFYNCSGLTSITIPSSVTDIGISAFAFCRGLTSITIPSSVESIEYEAFYNCSGLTSITIPSSVADIRADAFSNCSELRNITFEENSALKSIENSAFAFCRGLTSITIPDGVTSIGDDAFRFCYNLTSITIPNSVTSIGGWAFSFCIKMVEIYNLSSLDIQIGSINHGEIGRYAKVIHKDANEPSRIIRAPEGFEFIKDDNDKYYLFNYTGKETSLTLPSDINGSTYEISDYAFYNNSKITSITIPNSVTGIGDASFYNCTSLENVYYEGTIEDWCNITFRDYLSNPMYYASHFYLKNEQEKYTELINLVIPNTVTSIGNYQFYGFNNLTSITIPSSVTSIGYRAFSGWYKLVEIYNLSSLDIQIGSTEHGSVGEYAKVIHKDANEPSRIIRTPEGFEFIKDDNNKYYLFNYTGKETSLTLPSDIKGSTYEINTGAFYNCIGLTSVTIPSSVTSIGDVAFYNCIGLTSITIPSSVTSIGENTFYNCTSLENVYYEGTIEDWCNITFIDLYSNPMYYASHLYIKNEQGKYTELTNLVIPNTITIIRHGQFAGFNNLTSITIPSSVTRIGDFAFFKCIGLTSITIPNSVTSIGEYAFDNCISLTSITIPSSVANIGDYAFINCPSLAIYCEAPSKPTGWNSRWNYSDCHVVWAYNKE